MNFLGLVLASKRIIKATMFLSSHMECSGQTGSHVPWLLGGHTKILITGQKYVLGDLSYNRIGTSVIVYQPH